MNIQKAVPMAVMFFTAGLLNLALIQAASAEKTVDYSQAGKGTAAGVTPNAASGGTEGLGMNYTKIVVGNLPVGCTISMKTIANLPLKVKNNYGFPIAVNVQIARSDKAIGAYESIPDASWIKVEPAALTVPARSTSVADVLISIPNDEKYFGKKYVAEITTVTLGNPEAQGLSVGYSLTGYIMFGVAPGRNLEGLKHVINQPIDAAYTIFPPRVDLYNVVPGTLVKIVGPDKKPVELRNESSRAEVYNLKSVDPATTDFQPDPYARFTGVLDQVVLPKTQYRLQSGKRTGLDVRVRVPAKVDLTKGPLIYLVAVTSGAHQNVVQYLKMYLWDKSPMEKSAEAASNTPAAVAAAANTLSAVSAESNTPAAKHGK